MSMIERVAAFLKDRDESVMPHEADDAERMESAREILKAMLGEDGSIDLADMMQAIGAESVTLQPGISMSMGPRRR